MKTQTVYDEHCAWPYHEPYGMVEVPVPKKPRKRKPRVVKPKMPKRTHTPRKPKPKLIGWRFDEHGQEHEIYEHTQG